MKSMTKMKLLILLIIVSASIGDIESDNSTTYRSLIDGYKGFYRVINANTGITLPYDNHTFNISIGDNVLWINDDASEMFTIISEQELWKDDKAILRHTGSQFNYTFNESGTYVFSIKKHKYLPKQTIIVSDNITITPTPDITVTEPLPNITVVPNITDTEPISNVTPNINDTEPISNITPNITGTMAVPNITDTIAVPNVTDIDKKTNISNKNKFTISPILTPLNILRSTKLIVLAIFVVAIIFILIK